MKNVKTAVAKEISNVTVQMAIKNLDSIKYRVDFAMDCLQKILDYYEFNQLTKAKALAIDFGLINTTASLEEVINILGVGN